jgi:hypothetical protein
MILDTLMPKFPGSAPDAATSKELLLIDAVLRYGKLVWFISNTPLCVSVIACGLSARFGKSCRVAGASVT